MSNDISADEAAQVMYWPSLPEQPELRWHLANDVTGEKRAFVDLPQRRWSLSSRDLAWIISFAAGRRFEMSEELPRSPYECPDEDQFRADCYTFDLDPETQTVRVWSRLPGIGWVQLRLHANELREMATQILSLFVPQEQARQTH